MGKETKYRNIPFDNENEAKWAVFYDTIGFEWEYQPKSFANGDKTYEPTFLLTFPNGQKCYCDVKSEDYDFREDLNLGLYREFVNATQTQFLLLQGQPQFVVYELITPYMNENTLSPVFFMDYKPYLKGVDEYWLQRFHFNRRDGRLYFMHAALAAEKSFGKKYVEAVRTAQLAKFESEGEQR